MHSKQPKKAPDIFIAPPTDILKSSENLYRLPIARFIMSYFYFEKLQSVGLALRPRSFESCKNFLLYPDSVYFTYLHYKQ